MSWLDGIRHRLGTLARPAEFDRDARDEMAHHLELDAQHQRSRDAALKRYGNRTYYMEERREATPIGVVGGVVDDVRYLARSLARSPALATVMVLTLALGIGITSAAVSITDHILVRSLPFRDSDRLMMMLERDDHGAFRTPSAPTAEDWSRDAGVAQALEGVTYVRGDGVRICVDNTCGESGSAFVADAYFPIIGARAVLGRVLQPEDQTSGTPVAVISHKLWQSRFGGDPHVVGRSAVIDSVSTTVVGVLGPGAAYPGFADLWQPISRYQHPAILRQRGFHADSRTIGRLRAGIDTARAEALMRGVGARLAAEYPAEQARWMPTMITVQRELLGNTGRMLWVLAAGAIGVMLLACANVAGLLLARVTARGRELALRTALGASRGRLVRQLLTESLALSVVGGAAGSLLAFWAVRASRAFLAERLPRVEELTVDWRVLGIAAAATLLTSIVAGVWPAFLTRRAIAADSLRAGTTRAVGAPQASRMRRALVSIQFAVALVLVVGAGLLTQSFRRAAGVEVGFDPRNIVTVMIRPPSGYDEPDQARALYDRLMDAARGVGGVTDAAFINHVPFGRASIYTTITIDRGTSLDSSNQVYYRTVSPTYLRTMRMSMRNGRWFDDADARAPSGQFVINETMAKRYFPEGRAIGSPLTVTRSSQARKDFGKPVRGTVIGVVADVHEASQDARPSAEVYVPYTLEPWPWGSLVVRTENGASSIAGLTAAIRAVDPRLLRDSSITPPQFGLMQDALTGALQPRLLSIRFMSALAGCALLLACIGMYGVVAYGVSQRSREIGVRKAMGATTGSIVALILRESTPVIGIGAVAGTVGGLGGARFIQTMLFETQRNDFAAWGLAVGLVASVALTAAVLPALRASRLNPALTLRGE